MAVADPNLCRLRAKRLSGDERFHYVGHDAGFSVLDFWRWSTSDLIEPRRHADVYVFALLAHREQATLNPLDLSQWEFWAVPTKALDDRKRSQHSITLNSLRELAGNPEGFDGLHDAVYRADDRTKGGRHLTSGCSGGSRLGRPTEGSYRRR